jgi:hypothetical protein
MKLGLFIRFNDFFLFNRCNREIHIQCIQCFYLTNLLFKLIHQITSIRTFITVQIKYYGENNGK